jgi:hypothetical protein
MMRDEARDVGDMFRTTGDLLRENAGLVLAAIVVLTAIDVAGDRISALDRATALPSLIANLVFEYQIILNALVRRGYTERGRRGRFGAMLGLTIVSGVCYLLGFVLLVVPGIYLLIRWSVSVPVLVGEGAGVFESLTRSGEEVRGRFWPVLGFSLIFWAAFLLAAVASIVLVGSETLASSILLNLLLNTTLVSYWVGMVAVYMAGRPRADLARVFA